MTNVDFIKLLYKNGSFINTEQHNVLLENNYVYFNDVYIKSMANIKPKNFRKYYYKVCSVYNPKTQYITICIYKCIADKYIKLVDPKEDKDFIKVIPNRKLYSQQNSQIFKNIYQSELDICNKLRNNILNKSELDILSEYISDNTNLKDCYITAKIVGNKRIIYLHKNNTDIEIAHSRINTCKFTALLNNARYRLNHIAVLQK